jgi:multicomponent Na+:H+ antiporter subunit F
VTALLGWLAAAEAAVTLLLAVRLAAGPTVSDRIVALNTMATQATLSLFAYAAYADRGPYLDVALWVASFSYLGTIAWARYLERDLL